MTRISLLSLALAACNAASGSKLDTKPAAPRNLICERVAILSPNVPCTPEMSGVGELATHTARVSIKDKDGKPVTLVCGLNAGQLAMACSGLEVAQPTSKAAEPEAMPQPAKPKAK